VNVEGSRRQSMQDDEFSCVPDDLSCSGHEFGVQGIEFVWIGIGPEGQPAGPSDDVKGLLECSNDVIA